MKKKGGKKQFEVTLYRSKGRIVRSVTVNSKYAAKEQRDKWEDTHDDTYYVEIEQVG